MLPLKTMILLDREIRVPLYLQICNEIIRNINLGLIEVGFKLPGSRSLAQLLEVSRKTVGLAYEELEAQGWIDIKPNQGTFINSAIPVSRFRPLSLAIKSEPKNQSGFPLDAHLDFLAHHQAPDIQKIRYVIDTGYPDVRLAPLKSLSQALSRSIAGQRSWKNMNYSPDFKGSLALRKELVKYLAETRGIKVATDNILLTRGSLMAFSNIFQMLLQPGDKVAVGEVSFKVANNIIRIARGELIQVPVDEYGIDVDALEVICQQERIRAVFVMPHHHHPTTVSLSAARRMKLLMLAATYQFAIIEDDYDYDFHYASSPILPMASSDYHGVVIYVGSLSKTVAPGLRLGFIVAPRDCINALARLSRFMDCHGNTALEKAIASLLQEGIIRRHLKKALKVYKTRRDLFCHLLVEKLGDYITFSSPEGGLAVWVQFRADLPILQLRQLAMKQGLLISKTVFKDGSGSSINAIRMGFASLSADEMEAALSILQSVIQQFQNIHGLSN